MGDYDVIHIGFVTGHGGDALQMLTLARGIQATGLRTKIIVPRAEASAAFAGRCAAAGIPCERTPLIAADMAGPKQSLGSVLKLLRENRAPIMHIHSGNSCLPRSFMLAMELVRPRHAVATLQSPVETIVPGSVRARTWAFFANRRLDAVISPSAHGSRFQLRCGVNSKRVISVPNAIETARFASGRPSGPRAVLGLQAGEPIVLFSSRLDPIKRPVDAVHIFAHGAAEFPNAHLVFAGTGSEQSAVEEAARRCGVASRTHLVGYQTNVPDWLAAATVWLLPTGRENFSVAVLEALVAGCPVLATDCAGNDEVLVDEQNAFTFHVGDTVTAAARLARLLGDAELRARLKAGARQTGSYYSAESLVERVRGIYAHLGVPRRM
jgi:glycosyltransferase involved in cell wall biosynthesis